MAALGNTDTVAPLRPHAGASTPALAGVTEIYRRRLLAATIQAVGEDGYRTLSVRRVTSRARVSRTRFYEAFSGREDCFMAAFEEVLAEREPVVRSAFERESSWCEGIRAALASILLWMDTEPAQARLCIVEALSAGPEVQARRAEVLAHLARAVDGGRRISPAAREMSEVTSQALVGGLCSVLHTHLLQERDMPAQELLAPLMSMIVLPYLGRAAARRELSRPVAVVPTCTALAEAEDNPLSGMKMRITLRTVTVLTVIAEHPGASNVEVARRSGVTDKGQISKLLRRLERLRLVVGVDRPGIKAWYLTEHGERVRQATCPR
ncbi:MAG TPA: TetR/AcrR family transcriptional regulator [Solirubrobacteraceae bacterium]|nr:TetR/AcrR family transcriptional regulator [Solirubrobacteraceae bacterium]